MTQHDNILFVPVPDYYYNHLALRRDAWCWKNFNYAKSRLLCLKIYISR